MHAGLRRLYTSPAMPKPPTQIKTLSQVCQSCRVKRSATETQCPRPAAVCLVRLYLGNDASPNLRGIALGESSNAA